MATTPTPVAIPAPGFPVAQLLPSTPSSFATQFNPPGWSVVALSLVKLAKRFEDGEAEWRQDASRIAAIAMEVKAGKAIYMPCLTATSASAVSKYEIVDGRHRMYFFHSVGVTTLPFSVPAALAAAFTQLYA